MFSAIIQVFLQLKMYSSMTSPCVDIQGSCMVKKNLHMFETCCMDMVILPSLFEADLLVWLNNHPQC
jgi:hypothetical protein